MFESSETTAKVIDAGYKQIIEEFTPCAKLLAVAGKNYVKAMNASLAASKSYSDALGKMAMVAITSSLNVGKDIGEALQAVAELTRDIATNQLNVVKSINFGIVAPLEIVVDKDVKTAVIMQKDFQKRYSEKHAVFSKLVATIRRMRKKKSLNTEKQLKFMKELESAKERLETFLSDSLMNVLLMERATYGQVLEQQVAVNHNNRVFLAQSSECLNEQLPKWEKLCDHIETVPRHTTALLREKAPAYNVNTLPSRSTMSRRYDEFYQCNSIGSALSRKSVAFTALQASRLNSNRDFGRPISRTRSEYNLSSDLSDFLSDNAENDDDDDDEKRISRIVEYKGEEKRLLARATRSRPKTGEETIGLEPNDLLLLEPGTLKAGWQYGKNLTTGERGWIATENIVLEDNQDVSDFLRSNQGSPQTIGREGDYTHKGQLPPPPPKAGQTGNGFVQSNPNTLQSEYATLTRGRPRVSPPTLPKPTTCPSVPPPPPPASYFQNGTLKAKHYASQPNIAEANLNGNGNASFGRNGWDTIQTIRF